MSGGRRRSEAEEAWLRERYPEGESVAALAAEYGERFGKAIKPGTLAAWASGRGVRRSRALEWTPERRAWFRAFCPGHTEREISAEHERAFGCPLSEGQIANAKTRLGVRSGTHGGRFEPGREPFNKGRPQAEWMPPESAERTKATRFKKGLTPPNAVRTPVGSERVTKDGYVEVKVAERPSGNGPTHDNWAPKARLVWEGHHGARVPRGFAVVFADGDARNFDPENLVAVSRADLIRVRSLGLKYFDAASLGSAILAGRLAAAREAAGKRPRPCAGCGEVFEPRFARQRRCDACIEAGRA